MNFRTKKPSPYFLLIIFNILVWYNSTHLGFFNDNYQIFSYLEENTHGNLLKTFSISDLSKGYYRPIPNFFHLILLKVFSNNPRPFYVFQLFLYINIVLVLYKILKEETKNSTISTFISIFFSLLPSHDIYLAWIATNGDLLSTLFCLLALYFFLIKKIITFGFIFTTLGYLSKESSFVFPLMLFIFFYFQRKLDKKNISIIFGTLTLLFLLLGLRETLLDIHILSSKNLELHNLKSIIANLPISIVLNFYPTFALSIKTIWGIIIITFIIIFVLVCANKYHQQGSISFGNSNLFSLGLIWFITFSLPLIPNIMRWYVILPSVGLIFIIAFLFTSLKFEDHELLSYFIPVILLLIPINLYSQLGWKNTYQKANEILISASKIESSKPKALLWFVPYYYHSYFMLKSGTSQAFNYYIKPKYIDLLFPFPTKISNGYKVKLLSKRENYCVFKLENCLGLYEGNNEKKTKPNDYYSSEVNLSTNEIVLKVKFLQYKSEYENYYYNGEKFIRFY